MFDSEARGVTDAEIATVSEKTRAERDRDRYADKKASGECIKCDHPAATDSLWCGRHGAEAQESARAGMKRIAAIRRAAGLCTKCGQARPPKGKRKRLIPSVPIPATAAAWHTEGKRVTARTTRSLEKNGDPANWGFRTRFHGQGHRGHPSREQEDAWDLRSIGKELELGATALAYWHSAEVQAMPRIQRDAVLRDALAHFDLIDRQIEELVARAGRRLR